MFTSLSFTSSINSNCGYVINSNSRLGQLLVAFGPLRTVYILADSGSFKNFLYQGGVKSTVSWVFDDLKFKISVSYKQN